MFIPASPQWLLGQTGNTVALNWIPKVPKSRSMHLWNQTRGYRHWEEAIWHTKGRWIGFKNPRKGRSHSFYASILSARALLPLALLFLVKNVTSALPQHCCREWLQVTQAYILSQQWQENLIVRISRKYDQYSTVSMCFSCRTQWGESEHSFKWNGSACSVNNHRCERHICTHSEQQALPQYDSDAQLFLLQQAVLMGFW